MSKNKGKNIRILKNRTEKIVRCDNCKKEEVLGIDEKAIEGLFDQLNKFTNEHINCKRMK